ncbi:hypothetical protein [Streptomyces sp. NPDC003393]
MRAVIPARAKDAHAATGQIDNARRLADNVEEGICHGTAFGPGSVRTHQESVAVSPGADADGALIT